jgi:bla regulator protein blaR1
LDIATDGSVRAVKLVGSSGDPELDTSAANAAIAWQFSPATVSGKPVEVWFKFIIDFRVLETSLPFAPACPRESAPRTNSPTAEPDKH